MKIPADSNKDRDQRFELCNGTESIVAAEPQAGLGEAVELIQAPHHPCRNTLQTVSGWL